MYTIYCHIVFTVIRVELLVFVMQMTWCLRAIFVTVFRRQIILTLDLLALITRFISDSFAFFLLFVSPSVSICKPLDPFIDYNTTLIA